MNQAEVALDEVLVRRRAHDEQQYHVSSTDAEREMARLLSLLHATGDVLDVERQAKSTMDAVGLLWEAAARLSQ